MAGGALKAFELDLILDVLRGEYLPASLQDPAPCMAGFFSTVLACCRGANTQRPTGG
jgi:hypothetical protein